LLQPMIQRYGFIRKFILKLLTTTTWVRFFENDFVSTDFHDLSRGEFLSSRWSVRVDTYYFVHESLLKCFLAHSQRGVLLAVY
jgi:hypothetical protein